MTGNSRHNNKGAPDGVKGEDVCCLCRVSPMTKTPDAPKQTKTPIRAFPTIEKDENGEFTAKSEPGMTMETLMGTRTAEAANGIYVTAVSALGVSAEKFCSMTSAMFAELEPRDAIEAMLIAQMTATHVAMTALAERLSRQSTYLGKESAERSMTRLSRTYLAQMDSFKKYRSKAQQVVRVERVTVNEGGQAIVGDISHKERG